MPTPLEVLKNSRERVVAKRGADDPFVKSLDEKIAAAEKLAGDLSEADGADSAKDASGARAASGKSPPAPKAAKGAGSSGVRKTGSARSR
ncbi:MAG: hypothetical protein HQ503_14465 [Rhodospirillales bacterium]|nr:hypothetical protein [Rhodospirillales bacterium]